MTGTKPGSARKIWVTIRGPSESGTSRLRIRATASFRPASAMLRALDSRTEVWLILVSTLTATSDAVARAERVSRMRRARTRAIPRWSRGDSWDEDFTWTPGEVTPPSRGTLARRPENRDLDRVME